MQQYDLQRLQSLYNERLLEIKRQGVFVELNYRQQILPAYFQCSKNDYLKFKSIVESKISLELCDKKGIPVLKISRQQYFTKRDGPQDKYRVYLENKQFMRKNFQEGKQYILVKNNATIGVLSSILERRLEGNRYFQKIQNFIGDDSCVKIDIDQNMKIGEFIYQQDLNKEQNEAIQKAFNNHLTFVKGPPGCGKSKTVSRMVKMMAQRGLKVLVGSISNIANETLINEIVREVKQHNRLRELAPNNVYIRKLNVLINYSRKALQKMNEQANSFSINNQLYREIVKANKTDYYNEENIMDEIEKLQRGDKVSNVFFSIYMQCYNSIVNDVNIIVSTTINSFKLYEYSPFKPDVGIMDEAAQASWTDTYGFLAFGVKKMVFVGDQKQLRPTVIGDATANQILKETMFEKLSLKNQDYFTHLVEQYRMHPKISQFPNLYIYEGKLRNAEITLKERQSSIDYFKKYHISFVTHEFQERVVQSTKTLDNKKPINEYSNIHQGSLLMDLLFMIPRSEWKNVGVLTFYDMQCQALIENLKEQVLNFESTGLSVKTIDGYQGGQKDYILVSTVRSNPQKNPGFCIELNRVNVALTRAKRGLIVFGNPNTLTQGKLFGEKDQNIWGKFYQYMLKTNQVLTSDQFHMVLYQMEAQIKPIVHQEPKKQEKMQKINNIVNREQQESLLPKFYQQLTLIFESFQSLKIQQSDQELLQNNPKYRKQAKTLIGDMKKINKEKLDEQKNGLKQKIQNYLALEVVEKMNGKNKASGKQQKKDESFQQKFLILAKQNLTKKQCQYALNVINFMSSNLYEVMEKNSQDINSMVLNSLRTYLIEEKQKLVDSCWIEFEEDINADVLKNLSALKETQKLKTLVSLKLKFKVLIECSKEIQKLITSSQAPLNDKI